MTSNAPSGTSPTVAGMTATQLASFMAFLVSGVVSVIVFAKLPGPVGSSMEFRIYVSLAVVANACYYYCASVFIELDPRLADRLLDYRTAKCSRLEWWLRISINVLLFLAWMLAQLNLYLLFADLVVIYALCLRWDFLVKAPLSQDNFFRRFMLGDVVALVLTVVFAAATVLLQTQVSAVTYGRFGFASALYLLPTIFLVFGDRSWWDTVSNSFRNAR